MRYSPIASTGNVIPAIMANIRDDPVSVEEKSRVDRFQRESTIFLGWLGGGFDLRSGNAGRPLPIQSRYDRRPALSFQQHGTPDDHHWAIHLKGW